MDDLDKALKTTEQQQPDQAVAPLAPYGYKADGTPRKSRPGTGRGNKKAGKSEIMAENCLEKQEAIENLTDSDKDLKILQKDLFKLGKKAVKKLHKLLDDENIKVRLQAAGIATRSALLGLARDTLGAGGGAEIHIHTTVHQAGGSPPGEQPPALETRISHTREGKPIVVVK